MTINWKGNELIKKMNRAEARGINEIVKKAIVYALAHHPEWVYRTGVAENSITQKQFATPRKPVALWGSVWTALGKSNYVWYLEFFHGSFLRKSADVNYPDLAKTIKKAFKGFK